MRKCTMQCYMYYVGNRWIANFKLRNEIGKQER